jgi:hypothetical protein
MPRIAIGSISRWLRSSTAGLAAIETDGKELVRDGKLQIRSTDAEPRDGSLARRADAPQVRMTDRDRLLELGSAALGRGAWFEAHECWERAWRLSEPPDRPAVQALAQLAAALVHLSNGRRRGATSVLAKAHGKLLRPDTPGAVGTLDVAAVRSLIQRLRDELAAGRSPDLRAVGLVRR